MNERINNMNQFLSVECTRKFLDVCKDLVVALVLLAKTYLPFSMKKPLS